MYLFSPPNNENGNLHISQVRASFEPTMMVEVFSFGARQ